MADGWNLQEIDNCDLYYWLELRAYELNQADKIGKVTIDDIF